MGESIGICNGYFQNFNDAHRRYINECINRFNHVIVIINNDVQQNIKYKNHEKIRKFNEIEYQIKKEFPTITIMKSIDYDLTISATLKMIYLYYENTDNKLFFCKNKNMNIDDIDASKELKMEFIPFVESK